MHVNEFTPMTGVFKLALGKLRITPWPTSQTRQGMCIRRSSYLPPKIRNVLFEVCDLRDTTGICVAPGRRHGWVGCRARSQGNILNSYQLCSNWCTNIRPVQVRGAADWSRYLCIKCRIICPGPSGLLYSKVERVPRQYQFGANAD